MTALFKYILSSSKISFNCLLVAIVASLCSAKINLDILTNSIGAGTTLVGTTSDNLKELGYSIAVSGSIENYVNEHLKLMKCQIERGYVNVAFRTVSSGLREGFASHKAGNDHVLSAILPRLLQKHIGSVRLFYVQSKLQCSYHQ